MKPIDPVPSATQPIARSFSNRVTSFFSFSPKLHSHFVPSFSAPPGAAPDFKSIFPALPRCCGQRAASTSPANTDEEPAGGLHDAPQRGGRRRSHRPAHRPQRQAALHRLDDVPGIQGVLRARPCAGPPLPEDRRARAERRRHGEDSDRARSELRRAPQGEVRRRRAEGRRRALAPHHERRRARDEGKVAGLR